MNKPSERIVVFVTPAQKLAIASTAERLGISVSELMRRAVLNFGATSEQVKAASIVDRLNAPREPDALNAALQRVAAASKRTSARASAGANALAAGVKRQAGAQPERAQGGVAAGDLAASGEATDDAHAGGLADASASARAEEHTDALANSRVNVNNQHGHEAGEDADDPHASSPADAYAVVNPDDSEAIDEDAVARVTAAWRSRGESDAKAPDTHAPSSVPAPSAVRRAKPSIANDAGEDDAGPDPTAEGGRFA